MAILALGGLGCGRPAPGAGGWSVLLLTVDTLRPDYLSLNGYELPTSPALDALVGEGFYFEQALATVPRTTPSLASLLTGAYPHTTGVRALADALPPDRLTLAEAFRGFGYQTLAVVTNMLLATRRGLDAGFQVYDAALDMRDAQRTTDAALKVLARTRRDAPLFAWVHYIDPHVPYDPPDELAERFDPGYTGRFAGGFGRQSRAGEPNEVFRMFPDGLTKSLVTHRNPLSEAENAHIRRLYAAEIRDLDAQIERLVRAVRERFPDTIVVFAADHGESLGEHGFYYDHGDYVYNASSRVPLAFVLPEGHPLRGSGRRSGWVSLVDVAPTVLELVGREMPPEMAQRLEGRSLVPALRGEALAPRPVFTESGTSFFPYWVKRRQRNDVAGRFRAVTLGRWKLIWTPFLPEAEAFELYDVEADPHETLDLYRPDHPEAPALRRELDAWLARAPAEEPPAPPLEAPVLDALRALGYTE